MHLSTYMFLKNYIKNHSYGKDRDYSLFEIFKKYADKEIKEISDIVDRGQDFIRFIKKNQKKLLKEASLYGCETFEDDFIDVDYALNLFSKPNRSEENYAFAELINYFTGVNDKILDVGAGAIPYSSILLAKKDKDVTAMDKLMFSEALLKKFGVGANDGLFEEDTDISGFDYVVGNRPCGAIGQMVENCKQQNKAYIINLCHCEVGKYARKMGIRTDNWFDILPEIDGKIKVYDNFVTNLDVGEEEFEKVVKKYFASVASLNLFANLTMLFNECVEDLGSVSKSGGEVTRVVGNAVVSISQAKVDGEWKSIFDEESKEIEPGEEE